MLIKTLELLVVKKKKARKKKSTRAWYYSYMAWWIMHEANPYLAIITCSLQKDHVNIP